MRVLAAVAALGLVAAAVATAQSRPVSAIDPARDVAGKLDVRRVALGVGRDGRLRGEVTLRREWGTADLRTAAGPSASICMRLFVARDADGDPPDYLICARPALEGDALVGTVLRDRANGLPRKVGEAVVTRPSPRTVYLRFTRTDIGRPASVRFGAESVDRGRGCPRPVGCRDLAPDAPRTLYLQLRR